MGSTTDIRLEKDGYETLNTTLSRNERADVGAIVGGIFFIFPFLWTMKYNLVHTYELRPMGHSSLEKQAPAILKDAKGNEYISCVLAD